MDKFPYFALKLGLDEVARKEKHKHLGLILDSKLNFKSHIRQAILNARREIGMIKYQSKCVSWDVLDQVHKLSIFDIDGVKQLKMFRLEFSTLNGITSDIIFCEQVRCVLAI